MRARRGKGHLKPKSGVEMEADWGRDNSPMKVVMDTNGLFVPLRFGLDIFSMLKDIGYSEVLIPNAVMDEMKRLCSIGPRKLKKQASQTLKYLNEKGFALIDVSCTGRDVDGAILEFAREENISVFTGDRELKKRLKDSGVKVVQLRQKKRLEVV